MAVKITHRIHVWYIYIYARGGRFTEGSLSMILWKFKNCYFVVVKREFFEVTFYIEWCSARTIFFDPCVDRWKIHHSYMYTLWETCDLCGKMTILEMSWWSKRSKVLWATVFLELVSQCTGGRSEFEHENKLQCLTVKPFGVVLCCVCDLVTISV